MVEKFDFQPLLISAVQRASGQSRAFRLMFVCTGNICRSPLAHAVFAAAVHSRGLDDLFEIESCGTQGYHVGDNADSRMRACAQRHGVNLNHAARKWAPADLAYYDLILALDKGHLEFLQNQDREHLASGRILLYRDFDPGPGRGTDVPDPYYGDQKAFELVWQIVSSCSVALLATLISAMESAAIAKY